MFPEHTTANALQKGIDAYFKFIEGEYHLEDLPAKPGKDPTETIKQKVWDRDAQPPTLSGIALFLNFSSRNEFDAYEVSGAFADVLKRARLRIEAEYEKKLHYQSPTGAMFALKSFGWDTKKEVPVVANEMISTLQIEVLNTTHQPVGSENEVEL